MKIIFSIIVCVMLCFGVRAGTIDSAGYDTNTFVISKTAGTVTLNTNSNNPKAAATKGDLTAVTGQFVAISNGVSSNQKIVLPSITVQDGGTNVLIYSGDTDFAPTNRAFIWDGTEWALQEDNTVYVKKNGTHFEVNSDGDGVIATNNSATDPTATYILTDGSGNPPPKFAFFTNTLSLTPTTLQSGHLVVTTLPGVTSIQNTNAPFPMLEQTVFNDGSTTTKVGLSIQESHSPTSFQTDQFILFVGGALSDVLNYRKGATFGSGLISDAYNGAIVLEERVLSPSSGSAATNSSVNLHDPIANDSGNRFMAYTNDGTTKTLRFSANTVFISGAPLSVSADLVEQKNGTTAQQFNIYKSFTDASNYRRGSLYFNGNDFYVSGNGLGTGASSGNLILDVSGIHRIAMRANGAETWSFLDSGEFAPTGGANSRDIGDVSNPIRSLYVGTSVITPFIQVGTGGASISGDGALLSIDGDPSESDGPFIFDSTSADVLTIRSPTSGDAITIDDAAGQVRIGGGFNLGGNGQDLVELDASALTIGTVPMDALSGEVTTNNGTLSGMMKGNGARGVTAAVADVDYAAARSTKFFTNAISGTALAYTNANTFLATSVRAFIVCTNNDSASKYAAGDWTPMETWGTADLITGTGLSCQLSASSTNVVLSLEQGLTITNWKVVPKGGGVAVNPSSMTDFNIIIKASQF